MNYIAFDAHKRYTLTSVERAEGGILREIRVGHERGAIRLRTRRQAVWIPPAELRDQRDLPRMRMVGYFAPFRPPP